VQCLHKRAPTRCPEGQNLDYEISILRRDLQLNGYPRGFVDSVIDWNGSSLPSNAVKPLGSVYSPYVTVVSRKFKRIKNRCNIRTIFKTRQHS
jgi:hypothetical protein